VQCKKDKIIIADAIAKKCKSVMNASNDTYFFFSA